MSIPCAASIPYSGGVQHYFKEVQPVLRLLPEGLYGWLSQIIEANEAEFDALHPIVPNPLPNYVKGLDGELRAGSPPQITEPDTLGFMVRHRSHFSLSFRRRHSLFAGCWR